jgi:hypothetical protein
MKHLTLVISLLLVFIISSVLPVYAQEAPAGQLFVIHEDVVTPAKAQKYEQAAKNLKSMLEENQINSMSYQAANMMDFTYIYITPLNGVSDVETMNAGFAELEGKMGGANFKETMDKFTDCYDSHRDYLIRSRPDLSYKPEYGNTEDMNYRIWEIYYIYPGKEAEMEQNTKKWVALQKKHNIEEGYQMYVGEMGTNMPVIVRVRSAKSFADFFTPPQQVNEAFAGEAEKLWSETWSIVRKFEQKMGRMRPDLSYQPKAADDTGEADKR